MNQFESSSIKASVRAAILSQIEQYAKGKKNLTIATLPGVNWHFEKELITKLGKKLKRLVCFEANYHKYVASKANMPNDSRIDFQNDWFSLSEKVDVVWLDLCASYTEQTLLLISDTREKCDLFYSTVSLSQRCFDKADSCLLDWLKDEICTQKGNSHFEKTMIQDAECVYLGESRIFPSKHIFTYSYRSATNPTMDCMLTWGHAPHDSKIPYFESLAPEALRLAKNLYRRYMGSWRANKAIASMRAKSALATV